MELWKTITWNPRYEVSDYGRIRNKQTRHILSTKPTKSHKHPQVFLSIKRFDYDREQWTVSHIVYDHFVCKNEHDKVHYSYGSRIGHYDGDITNNKAENLYKIC